MARGGRGLGGRRLPGTSVILTVLAGLVLPIWVLAILAWCVQVAGLSAVQYQLGRHFVQFDWFVTAFEFVALMVLPGFILARRSSPGALAFKAVVTVLEILRTNVWNNARLAGGNAGQNFVQIDSVTNPSSIGSGRLQTLFAGYLITSFFNLLLILALGNLPAASAQDGEFVEKKARNASDQHHGNVTGTSGEHNTFPSTNIPGEQGMRNGAHEPVTAGHRPAMAGNGNYSNQV